MTNPVQKIIDNESLPLRLRIFVNNHGHWFWLINLRKALKIYRFLNDRDRAKQIESLARDSACYREENIMLDNFNELMK